MKKLVLVSLVLSLLGLSALAGCGGTWDGAKKDAHRDVEWVGHRF